MPRLFDTHKELLSRAVAVTRERTHWPAFPEVPNSKIHNVPGARPASTGPAANGPAANGMTA